MSSDLTLDCMFDAKPGCTCSHCQANRRIEALEGEKARLTADRDEWLRCYNGARAALSLTERELYDRAEAADARAERLRVALEEIKADPVIAFAVAERALDADKQ